MSVQKPKSALWYLLPGILGLIGGIIAFIILRKSDPKKAKFCLVFGVALMMIGIVFDLITDALGISVDGYVGKYGIGAMMTDISLMVGIPIAIVYYIITKSKNRKSKTP